MSAWIGTDQYLEYFNSPDSDLQGGITASMSAGSFAGALAAGFISDRIGRRYSLMLACCIWVIGAAIQCSAQNVAHLVAGRVISGLSVGITSSQVCVYLAELAPARIRGRIVGIQQWAIEWGMLIMYLISYGCGKGLAGAASFRVSWGVQGIPALILLAALPFFPESPRWLASKERWEEALDTLALLHAKGDRNDPVVQVEYEESGNTTLYSSAIQYVIFLVTTGTILPFVDRIGRRLLLLTGSVLCMACHFAIAGLMASRGHHVDSVDGNANLKWSITGPPGKGVIACSYIFVAVYGFTWAPVAWIYASEVFPLKYRAKGVGLSAAGNWIFNFALAYFVAPAFTNIQWKTYIIFGVFCTVMTFHVFFFYPETARRSLEDIDLMFETDMKPWKTHQIHDRFGEEVERHKHKDMVDQEKGVVSTHDEMA
ncbi:sugar transporter [Aspergillus luchuensis]|uniref:Sugar transporter n=1 Tax=Aspergillus kawachii TaxID=1069201 RepID=A0A146FAJ4_ASPKA|nr:sugar transporter [Aspergillus luchuensis]